MKLIEHETIEKNYGFLGTNAIIDSEEHGLLLVCDGYCGNHTEGESVRWKHSLAIKILATDTLENLKDEYGELPLNLISGYDDLRPVLNFDGKKIDQIMRPLFRATN